MDWEKLKLFHAVATAGSFTLSAKRLNMSQSALSRQIRSLEESLNLSLFTRHARGLVLTQEGEELFETAKLVLENIEQTEASLLESKGQPSGRLRVTTTVTFGTFWLTPRLKEFTRLYPDIRLELILSDDDVDLATGAADVAIRLHPPTQADLIQKPLFDIQQSIYGSAKYLSERGTPEKAEDLDQHALIVYGPAVPPPIKNINWILKAGATGYKRTPVFQVNSLFGVFMALKAGMGLAAIPNYLAEGHSDLIRILADQEGPKFSAYFVYPGELRGSRRVGVFRDYLLRAIDSYNASH